MVAVPKLFLLISVLTIATVVSTRSEDHESEHNTDNVKIDITNKGRFVHVEKHETHQNIEDKQQRNECYVNDSCTGRGQKCCVEKGAQVLTCKCIANPLRRADCAKDAKLDKDGLVIKSGRSCR
eukprot:gnl/TRDRNA2_/TRDRNA2_67402_c0_seq1.p1 gnl/TRDRNA2_/TRDRNA2_67402_c0~~gnl/TRDRNA2_/TRDRNA2_67402_c0_seq1.p1  ORF type:complete len:124 (+),score=19.16 gnl/TRDRNA2_/TRDRNA2_67402_c0_seq1:66-437(+)